MVYHKGLNWVFFCLRFLYSYYKHINFQVVTVYPLVAFMLRTETVLLLPFKDTRGLTITINVVIITLCILVACFCPSIGTIIR